MRALHDAELMHSPTLDALYRGFAVAELDPAGIVRHANNRFLSLFGCTRDEVIGKSYHGSPAHGSWLGDIEAAEGADCVWDRMRRTDGRPIRQRHVTGYGEVIWTEQRSLPIGGSLGAPDTILLLVTDVTGGGQRSPDELGKLTAINRSLAVVEFGLDGSIRAANSNFCAMFGYAAEEIVGRHHSLLVDDTYAASPEYQEFWRALRRGDFWQAEYRRMAKDHREIWIQASYNPVFGEDGEPFKVIKLASDITAAKLRALDDGAKIAAIDRSQAVVELAVDGTMLHANANFLQIIGHTLDEVVGQHHSLFVPAEDRDGAAYQEFWRSIRSGNFHNGEFPRIRKDGCKVWLRASYNPVLRPDGSLKKVVKFAVDITDEVAAREQMRLLSLVADTASNAVIITDSAGLTAYVNAAFTRMSGYELRDLHGRKPGPVLQGPRTDRAVVAKLRAALSARLPFSGELENYTKAGVSYWVSLFVNPVCNESGSVTNFISIQSDITVRRRAELQLEASNRDLVMQANTDALTGVANRHRFDSALVLQWRRAAAAAACISLLLLDVDRFKQFNDTYGHLQGDFCLRAIAQAITKLARRSGTLVARYGGEEFVVLLPGTDLRGASRVAEMMRAAIEAAGIEHAANQPSGVVTASIGVASGRPMPNDAGNADRLLAAADAALYRAKRAGRNRVETSANAHVAAVQPVC